MATGPALPLATGTLPLSRFEEPLLIDPDRNCLWMLVTAMAEAVPRVVDPSLDQVRRSVAGATEVDQSESELPWCGSDLPATTVLATTQIFETVTTRFTDASRLAALVDTGRLHLRVLERPQPNTVLTGPGDDVVLVGSDAGYHAVRVPDQHPYSLERHLNTSERHLNASKRHLNASKRHFYGPEQDLNLPKCLFETYEPLVTAAPPFRVSAPSRHRVAAGVTDRCGTDVAIDLLRALWTDPDPACDVLSARRRAMLIGARHELADRTIRRACADAGLGSPSSFTSVKQWLQEYGLITTDRVSQPVGRPRERVRLPDAVQNMSIFDLLEYARERVLESGAQ